MRRPFRRSAAAVLLLPATLLCACGSSGNGRSANPANLTARQISFGVDMARRGLWNEALFRFHQAEQLIPQSPRIQNNLAVAYEATGDFDKALEHYKKGLQLDPGSRELRANYDRFNQFYQGFRPPPKDQPRPTKPSDAEGIPTSGEILEPRTTGKPTEALPPDSPPANL